MKRKLLLFITTLTVGITMQSQTVSPVCPDFTDINAPYVKAFTGYTDDPFAVQGVVNGRHTIITTQGTDPHTGNGLSLLPPGEGRVIKLGNEQIGAEAEALTYRFIVDKDNPVLLVKFAVVLEDPGHDMIAQPRFVIRITDKDGNLIEDCAEYDVSAGGDIPGFQSYQSSFYTPVRWRDWTNIGLDVSRFAGQEVQVQFITYDCSASAHFGYAYFTASCMSNRLQLDGCSGSSQFTLEAPDNFESYLWSNGATTRTTTFNTAASNDSQISCTVTSATGCQFPLYAFVTTNSGGIGGSFQDIICEGEAYTKHHFNLPPQEAGKHFYQNTIVNPQTCDDDEVIELELTVIKRYNLIKAAICYGEDYTVNGFDITLPAVGIRRDTLHTGIIHGCDTYNVLELTVSASFNMPDVIQGDASPCSEELITYSFAGAESFASFEWTIPANAVFYKSNEYMQQIQLYYTDDTPGVLSLGGKNGCGSSTTSLPITPRPTHHIRFNEEICEGTDFNMHNFNLGVQDSVGYFVYEKHLESSLGCDSSVVLALNVLPMPEVRIEPDSAVLCNPGDEITLWALTDSMKYAEITEEAKLCGDYDIWYGKLTQSNPANFNIVNLLPTTCGIVYYYGSEKKIVIPNNISGRDVIGIGIGGSVAVGFGPVEEIILPSSVITINADAFSNNPALTSITIPESVVNIAPGIFDGCPNVTVRCYENSPIHQFAVNNSIKFELIEDCPEENAKNVTDIKIYDCDLNYLWNTGSTEGFITENPTETTEYSVTVTTQNGCSAEAKRTVIVNTNAPQTVHDTICEGDTYTKYGINATTSGVYPVTITKDDCSFTLNVNLKVNEKYEGKIVDVACAGEPYQRNGLDITLIDPGIFRDTLRFLRTTGCDSIVALEITVLPAAETFLRDTVCQNQPYNKNGFNLPAQYITGKFTHAITVPSSANCDSTIMLKLLVNPVFNHIISDEVEQNGTYNRSNFNFPKVTKDTTATVNLTSIAGCDSTVVLNLKVNCKNDTVFIADSIFVGQDYNKHGFTVPVQSAVTELSDTQNSQKILNLMT